MLQASRGVEGRSHFRTDEVMNGVVASGNWKTMGNLSTVARLSTLDSDGVGANIVSRQKTRLLLVYVLCTHLVWW